MEPLGRKLPSELVGPWSTSLNRVPTTSADRSLRITPNEGTHASNTSSRALAAYQPQIKSNQESLQTAQRLIRQYSDLLQSVQERFRDNMSRETGPRANERLVAGAAETARMLLAEVPDLNRRTASPASPGVMHVVDAVRQHLEASVAQLSVLRANSEEEAAFTVRVLGELKLHADEGVAYLDDRLGMYQRDPLGTFRKDARLSPMGKGDRVDLSA